MIYVNPVTHSSTFIFDALGRPFTDSEADPKWEREKHTPFEYREVDANHFCGGLRDMGDIMVWLKENNASVRFFIVIMRAYQKSRIGDGIYRGYHEQAGWGIRLSGAEAFAFRSLFYPG